MKKTVIILLFAVLFLTGSAAFAAGEADSKETNGQLIGDVMKRGVINLFTFPGEIVRTGKAEKENHPKAWIVTYFPRVLGNMATRLTSSINDMGVLPWYVGATKDKRALTGFFDLPDYVWQKL
jgi:hypothetical protein